MSIRTTSSSSLMLLTFDAVNKGDIPLLEKMADELFTPDFMEHDPRMPKFEPGPAGIKNLIHQVREEFTEIHATVHEILSHEDKVAYRFTLSMTEISSGKAVKVQLLALTRFAGGKMAEEWKLGVRGNW